MMLQKLLFRRTLMSFPRHCYTKQNVPAVRHFKGSCSISSSIDDKEEEGVIRNFLVYEKRKRIEQNCQTAGHVNSGEVEEEIIKPMLGLILEPKHFINHQEKKNKNRERCSSRAGNTFGEQFRRTLKDQPAIQDLMRYVKNASSCYIIKQDAADTLMKHLKKDLAEGDTIAEADPGPGILTKSLLEQTPCKVVSYEPSDVFRVHLRDTLKEFSSRHQLESVNLLNFYHYHLMSTRGHYIYSEESLDRLHILLKPLPRMSEQGVSSVKIVGSLIHPTCIPRLALSYTFQCCFFDDIYPDMYIYVPDFIYNQLISSSELMRSRLMKIPFMYYFDFEPLDTVPGSSFYSRILVSTKKNKLKKTKNYILLKISPKKNFHEIIPRSELTSFHFFMQFLNGPSKGDTSSFIFYLEKFIPGCGIEFIKNGFSVFDKPRQLSPERLLDAYKLFRSLPPFEDSMFLEMCKNWTSKGGFGNEANNLGVGYFTSNDAEFLSSDDMDVDDES